MHFSINIWTSNLSNYKHKGVSVESCQNSTEICDLNPNFLKSAVHNMYIDQKKFKMTEQNSTEITMIRPDELMRELGIKKSKYYEILKDLGIKASKDSTKRSYLTFEQAEDIITIDYRCMKIQMLYIVN